MMLLQFRMMLPLWLQMLKGTLLTSHHLVSGATGVPPEMKNGTHFVKFKKSLLQKNLGTKIDSKFSGFIYFRPYVKRWIGFTSF